MTDTLKGLNDLRSEGKQKPKDKENFLVQLNESLIDFEATQNEIVDHSLPIIFVIGLPRSGTTFCTQIIQKAFDLGYINNLVARFWLAPVTGIKLSQQLIKNTTFDEISSDYAATTGMEGIHEFGYFWRYWLRKETASDFVNYKNLENQISWTELTRVLGKIRGAIGKPIVMKNNFGGFHIARMLKEIPNSYFIHITRNPSDVAVSIEKARLAFFDNLDTWWATISPNYHELEDLGPQEQIIGQIKSLYQLYESQIQEHPEKALTIEYEKLAKNPSLVMKTIRDLMIKDSGFDLPIKKEMNGFEIRSYKEDERYNKYSGEF